MTILQLLFILNRLNKGKNMKERIIAVLEKLEKEQFNKDGYNVVQVIYELKIENTAQTRKNIRGRLRSLISKKEHPEFKTAGNEDIVHCPKGKYSGQYKLVKH